MTMTWNYRVMRHHGPDGVFDAIHEVYYDGEGQVSTWTETPVAPIQYADQGGSLSDELRQMTEALSKPILDFATGREMT